MADIVVVLGSVRESRQGINVSRWIADTLTRRGHSVTHVDPRDYDALLVMRQMYKSMDEPPGELTELRDVIDRADGYVAVSPEYNHSFSGAIKNAIDVFLEEWFHSPFMIATYSAGGFGGIRAAEALRPVLAEIGAPAIPSALAISKVQDVFDSDGVIIDDSYQKRLDSTLDEFEWYVQALQARRESGTPN